MRRVAVTDGDCCCGIGTGSCYFCCPPEDMPETLPVCLRFTIDGQSYAVAGTALISGSNCMYGFNGGPPFGPGAIGQWIYSGYLWCDSNGSGGPEGWLAGFELLRPSAFGPASSYSVNGFEAILVTGTCNPFCQSFDYVNSPAELALDPPLNATLTIGDCGLPCEPDGTGTGSGSPCLPANCFSIAGFCIGGTIVTEGITFEFTATEGPPAVYTGNDVVDGLYPFTATLDTTVCPATLVLTVQNASHEGSFSSAIYESADEWNCTDPPVFSLVSSDDDPIDWPAVVGVTNGIC